MTDIMAQFTFDIVYTDEQDIVLKFLDGKSRPNEAEGLSAASKSSILPRIWFSTCVFYLLHQL